MRIGVDGVESLDLEGGFTGSGLNKGREGIPQGEGEEGKAVIEPVDDSAVLTETVNDAGARTIPGSGNTKG